MSSVLATSRSSHLNSYHPSEHVDGLLAASEAGAKSGISKDEMLDYGLCLETATP